MWRIFQLLIFAFSIFLTGTIHAQSFTIVHPKNNQYLSSEFQIEWNKLDGVEDYVVQIAADSVFSSLIFEDTVSASSFQYSPQNAGFHFLRIISSGGVSSDTSNLTKFYYFMPSAIDSLNLWLRADTGLTITAGGIEMWQDLSDSSIVLNQSNAGRRPTLVADQLNHYPIVYFDAIDDNFITPVSLLSPNFTIASVYNTKESSRGILLIRGSNNWIFGPFSGLYRVFNGGFISGKSTVVDQYVTHTASSKNDTTFNYVNNVLTGSRANSFSPGQITLGTHLTSSAVNGNLAELIIVNGEVSESERSNIDNYLMDKYAPPVNAGKDRRVCSFPDSIVLDVDYALDFTWSTGDTTSSITVNSSGMYYVTLTDMFERVTSDSVLITLDTITAPVNLFPDTTICFGNSVRINAGNDLYQYQWNTGDTNKSILVDSAANYKVTVTNCFSTSVDSVNISISNPEFSLGNDTSICFYESIQLMPDTSYQVSYLWSNSSTDSNIIVSQSGAYSLTITDNFSCESSDVINIISDSILSGIDLGPDTALCAGNSVGLVEPIANVDMYQWTTASTDSFIVVNSSQKYYLTVTENGCRNTDSVDVTIKGIAPVAGFTSMNNCFGDSIRFTDTSFDQNSINLNNWKWYFGDRDSTTVQNPVHYFDSAGTYAIQLFVENDSGCVGLANKNLVIDPKPNALFSVGVRCEKDSVRFSDQTTITTGFIQAYSWNFGDLNVLSDSSNISNPAYKYPINGNYNVSQIVQSDRGCLDTIVQAFIINPSPNSSFSFSGTIIGDTSYFTNQSTISSGNIVNNSWDFGNGSSSNLLNPKELYLTKGSYSVSLNSVSDSGCTDVISRTLTITDPPAEFNTVSPKIGQVVSSTVNFVWNSRDSASSYTLEVASDSAFSSIIVTLNSFNRQNSYSNFSTASKLFWRVRALIGNSSFDTTNIASFNFFDPSSIDSLNLWIRADTGLTIAAGAVEAWQDLSDSSILLNQSVSNQRPSLLMDQLNHYPVISFDAIDDRFTTPVNLLGSNFTVSSVYNTKEISRGITMIRGSNNWIFGPFSGSYRIFNGGFITGKPTVIDRYVTHTASSKNDTTSNYVNNVFTGLGANSFVPGQLNIGSTLSASAINGNIAELIIVNGSVTESERVNIDNYLMDKYAPPVDAGPDKRICSFPDSIVLDVDYAIAFDWSTGDTTSSITVNSDGKYFVTVTDVFERTSVDSVYIILDTANYQVDLFPDTTICIGDSIRIDAGNELYTYRWNIGDTTNVITVDSAFTYKVTVRNCFNNVSIDSVQVTINNPVFSLGIDTSLCFYDSLELIPDTSFQVNYLWSTGSSDSSIIVTNSNNYSLTVTDNYGCVYADTIIFSSDSILYGIDLGADTALCSGNSLGLVMPIPNIDSYFWSTTSLDSFVVLNTSQKYFLTVSENGCQNIDSVDITIKGAAPIVGYSKVNNCFQDSIRFTDTSFDQNSIHLNNWKWYFGDGDSSLTQHPVHYFDSAGNYLIQLLVENDSGCIGIVNRNLTIDPKPLANFTSSLKCEDDTIQFSDLSTISNGSIQRYFWGFGDLSVLSDSAISQHSFYKYPTNGTYTVSQIIESDKNCLDTAIQIVLINPSPNSAFSFSGTIIGDSTFFTNQSSIQTGSITSYSWDFGNSTSSSLTDPKLRYQNKGKYFVSLQSTSDSSCVNTIRDSIFITDPPPIFNTVYPKNGQTVFGDVNFVWNERDSITDYTLEISLDSIFSQIVISTSTHKEEKLISTFPSSSKFFWRVRAINTGASIDTTNIASFCYFDPLSLDSLNFWIKADTGLTITAGEVEKWQDLSDSSILLDQSNASRRPMLLANQLNHYPVVSFDDVDDQFITPVDLQGENFTISSVYNTMESSRGITMIRGSNNWIFGPFSGFHRVFNGGFITGKPTTIDRYVTHTASSKDDTTSNYVNNEFTGLGPNSFAPGQLNIGSTLSSSAINGNIAEIIVVNGLISENERNKMDNYLMDKYAPPVDAGADRQVCSFPDSITLDADYAISFNWSTGDTTAHTLIDSAGLYYVTITDMFDRISVDSVQFILDTSDYQIGFGFIDTTFCLGNTIELEAGRSIYNYLWNTGDTSESIVVGNASTYVVTVENCKGNFSTDSVQVIINNPAFSLGADTTICHNGIISISPDSSFTNVNYIWSTGETSVSVLADTSKLYSLSVVDNYNCIYTDTISVSIDSTLFGLSLGPDTSLCAGNFLALTNPNTSISSYLWTTGNTSSMQLIDTAGSYQVNVGNGRCFINDTANIAIQGLAPVADFLTNNFCFKDTVRFTDLSNPPLGDTLISWTWSFGDGTSDNSIDTKHNYNSVSSFSVFHKVTTNKACSDTITKIVFIEPKPSANFGYTNNVACSKSQIDHLDSSTISRGAIIGYLWNFGDTASAMNTSNQRNEQHQYDTLGFYSVTLITESDMGCKDTISKVKYINPSPAIAYSFDGTCLNDSTYFYDQTIVPMDTIFDYFWAINGQTPKEKDVVIKFGSAGRKQIVKRIITGAGCSLRVEDSISIYENPIAAFAVDDICEEIEFNVVDTSFSSDSISSYQYIFDNKDTAIIQHPFFTEDTAGNYNLSLKVTSIQGCIDSTNQVVVVNQKPIPDFTILNNNSGIPFEIDLINNSQQSETFVWKFGNGDSSHAALPNYTYIDTGTYSLGLITTTEFGCVDSTFKNVTALQNYLDAFLSKIFITENPLGDINVSAQIVNSGFNTIKQIRLVADLNNQFQFRETFDRKMYSGQSRGFEFSSSFIQQTGQKVDFICVKIELVNGVQDSISSNNELCERAFNNEILLQVYPNPVEEYLTLEYVLPQEGELIIQVYDQLGRLSLAEQKSTLTEGYYNSILKVSNLRPGMYHYRFIFNGIERVGMFLKR